ncbi:hypothetical protein B0O80DRAFT_127681 [Mortierella sp. GBAus27b]|nr:hypothetical protein B0O80DRAFT_127681 [Mortierella sp. GBAus27b]
MSLALSLPAFSSLLLRIPVLPHQAGLAAARPLAPFPHAHHLTTSFLAPVPIYIPPSTLLPTIHACNQIVVNFIRGEMRTQRYLDSIQGGHSIHIGG